MKESLQSTVEQLGEKVTQIIHFSGGSKRTFEGVITSTIKQGEFTKYMTENGGKKRMIMVNTANVDCIEVFTQ